MAVIKIRKPQEDGHYQVSLYDEKKQELLHYWSENKNGKKDGEEIECFKGSRVVKRKTNWKDGKKDGSEKVYSKYGYLLTKNEYAHLLTEKEYKEGQCIKNKKYKYMDIGSIKTFLNEHTQIGHITTPLKETIAGYEKVVRINGLYIRNNALCTGSIDEFRVSVIEEDGKLAHITIYGSQEAIYDMEFKDGKEYTGYFKIKGVKADDLSDYVCKDGVIEGTVCTDTFDGKFKNGKFTGKKYCHNDQWQTFEDGNLMSTNIGYDIQITQDGTVFVDKYNEHIKYQTKDGKKNGIYTEFFDKLDGKMKVSGFYKEGKKEGFWKYYADNGTVIKQEYYHKGKNCTNKYEAIKKVASKRIEEENKLSEGKDERVVLPKMTAKEKRKAIRQAKKELSR